MIPHLALPFRLPIAGGAPVVDQGSIDEVAQSVAVLVATEPGSRLAVPDFGTPDQLFSQAVDTGAILAAIATWEPRALVSVAAGPGPVAMVTLNVSVDGTPPAATVSVSVLPTAPYTGEPSPLIPGATYDGGNATSVGPLVLDGSGTSPVLDGN